METKIYKLIISWKQTLFVLALTMLVGTASAQATFNFSYTGASQTIALGGGTHIIEMWGADGGDNLAAGTGGKGGYAKGTYNVTSPGTYYVYVGGRGITQQVASTAAQGGFNGGGNSGAYSSISLPGGSGGGASHVASLPGLLSTLSGNQSAVAIVAGGGGGSGSNNGGSNIINKGGHAGGLVGSNGMSGTYGGLGGTQTAGGSNSGVPLYSGLYMAEHGSFGKGGSANLSPSGITPYPSNTGGGGGGGWYGGAAALWEGGGGGSSYITGLTSATTIAFGQPGYINSPDPNGNGYVIITRLCDVNVTASKNPICQGESVVLSTNAGSNIQWNTGPTTTSILVSPSSTTGYTVSGVSSSSTACTSTVSILVTVNPLPVIALESFPPVFCAGAAGSVFATGAVTYTWSNSTTGPSTVVNPLISTVYTATGTSVHGCKNTETVMVNVNTNSLTVTSNTTICLGSSAYLMASGVTGALWSNGLTFLNIQVTPATNTVYSVSGQDALGCTLTNTVTVNVTNLPVIGVTSDKQTVCRGESVTLTASGGTSYLWSNAQTTAIITETLTVNVPYHFSVTGTDASGCSSTAMITVNANACTGMDESEMNTISIFPNPASQQITLSTPSVGGKNITVSDVTGKIVLSVRTDEPSFKINIESLPAGLYHIRVVNGNNIKDEKFVKH